MVFKYLYTPTTNFWYLYSPPTLKVDATGWFLQFDVEAPVLRVVEVIIRVVHIPQLFTIGKERFTKGNIVQNVYLASSGVTCNFLDYVTFLILTKQLSKLRQYNT